MLSRRHLRIKALQALYSYFMSNDLDLAIGEKNMVKSTARIYELIMWQIGFIMQVVKFASKRIDENKKKFYPTPEDLNPNTKFIDNLFLAKLAENKDFIRKMNAFHINWSDEEEMVRKIYNEIRACEDFKKYMSNPARSFSEDREIIVTIFRDHIAYNDALDYFYEEKNIFWVNDLEIANPLVIKILNWLKYNTDEFDLMPPLYNTDGKEDPDEDRKFLIDLYHKTILKGREFESIIENKAKNWEINRIAAMDVILLKMALTELTQFQSIPVKVTMNEYIELSKYYSTPKSRVFINGILDKLIEEMKDDKQIVKIGRGLVD
ncbi:MAG: transcription antitermination factor NusB [Bacteroidales bacterium]|nr:transcription antitermination factor NusB [Bacteroidales bacterium]